MARDNFEGKGHASWLVTPRGGKWARPPLALWWHYCPRRTSEFVVMRGVMWLFVKLLWPIVVVIVSSGLLTSWAGAMAGMAALNHRSRPPFISATMTAWLFRSIDSDTCFDCPWLMPFLVTSYKVVQCRILIRFFDCWLQRLAVRYGEGLTLISYSVESVVWQWCARHWMGSCLWSTLTETWSLCRTMLSIIYSSHRYVVAQSVKHEF